MTVAVVVVGLVSCTRTFIGEAVQPNPLATPLETLRTSERIMIVTGDMELDAPDAPNGYSNASPVHNHHYPLRNTASFTMVSRDRLRFHVQIDHKWEEWADLHTWDVDLYDDSGRHWQPEAVEHARTKLITTMWDREQRTSVCNSRGRDATGDCYTTVGTVQDGWRNRQTLGTLGVYRGTADFVFYERDLFTKSMRWLTLTVHRPGQAFEFTWSFEDTVAAQ